MSRLLGGMFQKVQEMKTKVDDARAALASQTVSATRDGIGVVASCDKQIVSIDIGPDALVNPLDKALLEKKIVTVANEALGKAEEIQKAEIQKAMGAMGLNLPGLF